MYANPQKKPKILKDRSFIVVTNVQIVNILNSMGKVKKKKKDCWWILHASPDI